VAFDEVFETVDAMVAETRFTELDILTWRTDNNAAG
jgi:hypothetical protein